MARPKKAISVKDNFEKKGEVALTRADIARAAGVSPGLVSAFFSGTSYSADSPKGIGISQATRKKIIETCSKLNYVPKDPALFVRIYPEKSDVAFLLSDFIPEGFANPYFSLVLDGVVKQAEKYEVGVQTFYFTWDNDYLVNPSLLPAPIRAGAIKKVLVSGGGSNYSLLLTLQKMGVTVVQLSMAGGVPGVISVVPDFYQGAFEAIQRIYAAGHRHIAVVAEPFSKRDSYRGNLVRQGCIDAMAAVGIPFEESDIIVKEGSGPDLLGSVIPALARLKPFPTAIFCFHDWTAQLLIPLLVQHGYRIPEDISIVGIDDDRVSQSMSPGLTTIHVPHRRIGSRAFDELQKGVSRPVKDSKTITLPVEWVERETLVPLDAVSGDR